MAESSAPMLNLLTIQSGSKHPDRASLLRTRLERNFEFSLFLLVTSGFATIAATGALDFFSIVLVSAALLVRGFCLLGGRTIAIPEKWDVWFSLAYVGFIAADYYFLSGRLVTAAVHLVLFSVVVKLFSTRRDRDYLYLAVLAFLEVLASCVLTVDTVFVPSFIIFILLAVLTFTTFEVKRSWTKNPLHGLPNAGPESREGRFTRSLGATALGLVAGIVLLASFLFFLLPRVTAGYLARLAPRNRIESGFSEEVRLGQIGEIQQSSAVVMHIQIDGDRNGAHELYWRGLSLSLFDGKRWSNPLPRRIAPISAPGRFDLRSAETSWQTVQGEAHRRNRGDLISYRVLMEPIGTNVFFLTPTPSMLDGDYRVVSVDAGSAVFNADGDRPIASYRAVSDIAKPAPDELRSTSNVYPAQVALRYLQVPKLDARVHKLADEITRSATNPYDKAREIERYLGTHYGYTLQLPATIPPDPLAHFLFERKQGHCEFFASSMAIMLRTLGIPSRVVNGFRGGEFNSLTNNYIIRARQAHSWVEAYFPGYGWATFDPTPPSATTPAFSRLALYLDATQEFWREWIVNYDFSHQRNLSISAVNRGTDVFGRLRRQFRELDVDLILKAYKAEEGLSRSPREYAGWVLLAAGILVLGINFRVLRRSYANYRLRRDPGKAPQEAATLWYNLMAETVARRGWRKLPTQTPQEFVSAIDDSELKLSVAEFTRHYCLARFGASVEDVHKLPILLERIQAPRRGRA